ncbi:4-(cytidine 5'-diphospho)-2-C-methyl-D-erythritol kinase [Sphingomonas sp. GCM10030256]|uniref:4-(cytidine 5'-diphospho)-2-C-methyl-D-erythritol kinase n=1 Tax=Sphingomonas sp. GCM10030256 TaxID=3273427 RepID=UPI003620AD3A
MNGAAGRWSELAPAKINLALHVRGRLPDGRHAIETLFAFCTDGDRVEGWFVPDGNGMSLELAGPFASNLGEGTNLIERAWDAMRARVGVPGEGSCTAFRLTKTLPVASGVGGGSADAAAALRLMTAMWGVDPSHAAAVAPSLGADVPACLLSMTARGEGAGDALRLIDDPSIPGTPILLVNPREPLSTREVFARWEGADRGALGHDWRGGRNDLEAPARLLVPAIGEVLDWLAARDGVQIARMSGSGATCFALLATDEQRDAAASACPERWWHLSTSLR